MKIPVLGVRIEWRPIGEVWRGWRIRRARRRWWRHAWGDEREPPLCARCHVVASNEGDKTPCEEGRALIDALYAHEEVGAEGERVRRARHRYWARKDREGGRG